MMNSLHLKSSLTKNILTKRMYGGIYHNANFMSNTRGNYQNYYFIVNTESDASVLGHWIVYFHYGRVLYFIDSFGKNPDFYGGDIEKYYNSSLQCKYVMLKYQIQHDTSLVCGAYAIYFIYYLCNGYSPTMIKSKFSRKYLKKNDRIVERFLYKINGNVNHCDMNACSFTMFNKKCLKLCQCIKCVW